MKYVYFVIVMLVFSTPFAYAQECKQLCLADQFYEQGDAVIISGKVDVVVAGTPIIIQIFYGQNVVDIAQKEVAQDGSYTATFNTNGAYWKNDGKYTVRASYGPSIYETGFDFQTKATAGTTTEIFEVNAAGSGTFDVPYTIKGGTIKSMLVDPDILGVIVTIQADKDGSLTLDLARSWIDAKKSDGTDDTYIILIDGLEVPYQESSVGPNSRIVTIQFQEGDSDIEIIGTYVIPEFGPIVLVVLVVAIFSVVIATRKVSVRFN